jgi:hypothetical protein
MLNKVNALLGGAMLLATSTLLFTAVSPTQAVASTPAELARSFVLTNHQVGTGFSSSAESYTLAQLAAQGTWTITQLRSWGYKAGFERVFDKDLNSRSAEQIASNAGIYRSAAGAAASLEANGNA